MQPVSKLPNVQVYFVIGQIAPMLRFFQGSIVLLILAILPPAFALDVEATGQAVIHNNDIGLAREQAINDAKQQASLQAGAYISSTQQIDDGILSMDNLRIATQGRLDNVRVLREYIQNQRLHVTIQASVLINPLCPNGNSGNSFRKTVAIAAFPLANPSQANLGGLTDIEYQLAQLLARELNQQDSLTALNAGHILLHQDPQNAATTELLDGSLTTLLQHSRQLDVQYIVAGVIRDLSMHDNTVINTQNWLMDTYNRLDVKSPRHHRQFALDLFIYEGLSGRLLQQTHYQTQGRWPFSANQHPGFASAEFFASDYGTQVAALLQRMTREVADTLRCQPFSARITQLQGDRIWIDAGINSGLHPGDRLSVLRKHSLYDPNGTTRTELINTTLSVQIDQVHANSAQGVLSSQASEQNIQAGDIVRFW